ELWRRRIAREDKRECQFDCRAVRLLAFASEIEHVEIRNARSLECLAICNRIAAVEQQHRKTLAACKEIAAEGTERKRSRAVRHDLLGFGDLQQLDVAVLQLHDAVMRAPGMPVAIADHEPGAGVEV